MDALKAGNQYAEMDNWAKKEFNGITYFDAERIICHMTEKYIAHRQEKNGEFMRQYDGKNTPSMILSALQRKI